MSDAESTWAAGHYFKSGEAASEFLSLLLTPRSEISSLKIDQDASLDEYEELLDLTLGWPSLPKLPEWAKKIIAEIESLDLNYVPFL
jgi:hypothetical protein